MTRFEDSLNYLMLRAVSCLHEQTVCAAYCRSPGCKLGLAAASGHVVHEEH